MTRMNPNRNMYQRAGIWYVGALVDGRRLACSLETESVVEARQRRDDLISKAKAGKWEQVKPAPQAPPPAWATVGQVLALYPEVAGIYHRSKRTIPENISTVRRLVRNGMGVADPDVVTLDRLDGAVVGRLERFYLARAGEDEGKRQSALRSVSGMLRNTRAVLQPRWVKEYRRRGLAIPDLSEFLDEKPHRAARLVKVAETRTLIESTARAIRDLQATDAPAFFVLGLAVASVRADEIARCQWSWFTERDGVPMVIIPAECKSSVTRLVVLPAGFFEFVQEFHLKQVPKPANGNGAFCLDSQPGAQRRCYRLLKRCRCWLRSHGWTGQKALHALRAARLREVRALAGEFAAMELAGHSMWKTTHDHYVGDAEPRQIPTRLLAE